MQTGQKRLSDSTPTTRCTRRSQFVVLDNSEKENPFITPKKSRVAKFEDDLEIDELAEGQLPTKRTRGSATAPAKHGAIESRVALSPAKINSHFKTSKANVSTDAKTSQVATPSTPRHRDACANKVVVTPRHRVLVAGKPLTPRTPRTPTTPRSSVTTIYNDARQLFIRGSQPGRLIGRDEERKELQQFVSSRVNSRKSGCLYISGPPGTGKSALVNEICEEVDGTSVKRAYINCMSAKSAGEIYVKLLEELGEAENVLEGMEKEMLQEILFKRDVSYLVTLDEVDYLLELDLELLYNIFEWSMKPKSSLVLLGIANALDFTDRFLPRLKSRGLKPHLLPFMPYTAPQVASVISSKLKTLLPSDTTASADFVPFLHPTAIQFLSKKVAAQTGDLRKAFDICRRAIDMVESDTRNQHAKKFAGETDPTATPSKTILIENMNLSSPARTPSKPRKSAVETSLSELTVETAPRASIAHMARVTAAVFSNGTSQRLKSLNLQQKAVLCALSALEKKLRDSAITALPSTPSKHSSAAAAAPTIKALYDTYACLCKRDNVLHPLTSTEFRDVITSLETLSLVSALEGNGKSGSFTVPATPSKRGRGGGGFSAGLIEEKRISSSVGMKELSGALEGPGSGVLKDLLNGEIVA
ncbi:ATPase AAA+ type core [Neofusicoccum parvum]|uniref:Cell division control protein n=1 Tax=Botryosphaeria parva (strain UCR-NP2) TaxID=1287680 RepID=R1EP16_BOTPV|nr:putative cell division control protein [Neofusicoccum parvum UCRNP2]GME52199.1 ATPase AAA+ type core [Neofusicoccum parvum]